MVTQAPRIEGRTLGVIELELDRKNPPQWMRSLVSLPGRDGVLTRSWVFDQGRMEGRQWDDLLTWLQQWALDALTIGGGVQLILDLD
jgi:hypothetical protein